MVKTDPSILSKAAEQGIWALLFVGLLFYVLRVGEKREDRLMSCLEKFGEKYDTLSGDLCVVKKEVNEIGKDVAEFRDDIKEIKGRV